MGSTFGRVVSYASRSAKCLTITAFTSAISANILLIVSGQIKELVSIFKNRTNLTKIKMKTRPTERPNKTKRPHLKLKA